ncbi:hypothetical protein RJ639_015182 [Escallonia herrerae]|uniref:Uncharacterized protein n=1 Tax=Escallonia herrerae TaxID=1293975 RepID=A0AA89APM2_9ASTE|nr:hypothetical protein RJ639_015182 [Escallonia herrerae]
MAGRRADDIPIPLLQLPGLPSSPTQSCKRSDVSYSRWYRRVSEKKHKIAFKSLTGVLKEMDKSKVVLEEFKRVLRLKKYGQSLKHLGTLLLPFHVP